MAKKYFVYDKNNDEVGRLDHVEIHATGALIGHRLEATDEEEQYSITDTVFFNTDAWSYVVTDEYDED